MGDIVGISNNGIMNEQNTDLQAMTDALLLDVRSTAVPMEKSICMPIAQLTTLGAGVSSLIPVFNSVTQTMTMNTQGLYQLVKSQRWNCLLWS